MDLAGQLERLAQLRDAGALSEDEFELAKQRVLQGPGEAEAGAAADAEVADEGAPPMAKSQQPACCPRCRSEQVAPGTQGFGLGKAVVGGLTLGAAGLLAGSIGSKKLRLVCLKCGHRWDPASITHKMYEASFAAAKNHFEDEANRVAAAVEQEQTASTEIAETGQREVSGAGDRPREPDWFHRVLIGITLTVVLGVLVAVFIANAKSV